MKSFFDLPFWAQASAAVCAAAAPFVVYAAIWPEAIYRPVGDYRRAMVLVRLEPPTNFKVVLRDVETGHTTGLLRVSKHCSRWKEMQANVGKIYNVTYTLHRNGRGETHADYHVTGFCPGK